MSLREELNAGKRFQGNERANSSRNLKELADAIFQGEILPIFSTLYEQWERNRLFIRYLLVDVNFSKETDYTIYATPWVNGVIPGKKVVRYAEVGIDKWALWKEVERIARDEWKLETQAFQGVGEYFLLPLC